jgi:hypothetical protein
MIPALARMKRAVREDIARCGGVDGAGATASRSRSTAGDWNNLNHDAFPPLDCAMAMDEVCVAQGNAPAILMAMAAELGHVCIRLPEAVISHGDLSDALIDASAEFGDIAGEIRDATRDGAVNRKERDRIIGQIDQAVASLARLRAVVEAQVREN